MELVVVFLYFALLVVSSYCFHRRYGCVKASLLSGALTSACIGGLVEFLEMKEKFSMSQLLGMIAVAVIFGTIFSACLSALIGAACQIQKK